MTDGWFTQRKSVKRRPASAPLYADPIGSIVRQLEQRDRLPNRERRARTLPRVRIVDTKPAGPDVWLSFDNGETLIVGGRLRSDVRELRHAVEDSLDAALVLPKGVERGGKDLAAYLLNPRPSLQQTRMAALLRRVWAWIARVVGRKVH